VTPTPGVPPNPALIVADTSALIQIVVGEEITPLRILKQDFGIQVVVHEAVETEINWRVQKRFPEKRPILKKAFANRTIEVLSRAVLESNGYKAGKAVIDQIDTLGQQFSLRIDRGEAYTHAAGNVLSVPALSQDIAAIWGLINDKIDVQRPILRAFDILAFGVQTGAIDWDACAKARKHLIKAKETILPCFQNCSVEDGMPQFYLRLCDSGSPLIGATAPIDKLDDRIYIRRAAS
jgi:hypothetical protein